MGVKHIHTNIFVLLLLKAVAKQFFSGWIPDDSYLSGIAMPSVDVALFGKKAKLRLQLWTNSYVWESLKECVAIPQSKLMSKASYGDTGAHFQ